MEPRRSCGKPNKTDETRQSPFAWSVDKWLSDDARGMILTYPNLTIDNGTPGFVVLNSALDFGYYEDPIASIQYI